MTTNTQHKHKEIYNQTKDHGVGHRCNSQNQSVTTWIKAEAKEGYWNCPCVPMRERHECHCMLFLTEDNDFAGKDRNISFEEVKDKCGGFSD